MEGKRREEERRERLRQRFIWTKGRGANHSDKTEGETEARARRRRREEKKNMRMIPYFSFNIMSKMARTSIALFFLSRALIHWIQVEKKERVTAERKKQDDTQG